jgi:hypothetical protein
MIQDVCSTKSNKVKKKIVIMVKKKAGAGRIEVGNALVKCVSLSLIRIKK